MHYECANSQQCKGDLALFVDLNIGIYLTDLLDKIRQQTINRS